MSSKHQAEWRAVWNAYATEGPEPGLRHANPIQTATLGSLVLRWLQTHDPGFMDTAVEYCHVNNLPIQKPLLKHLADAARLRHRGRTPRAVREGVKEQAFKVIANLVLVGAALTRAAEVASVWTQNTPHPQKASTLEKQYVAEWRTGSPNRESELLVHRLQFPDQETDAAWLQILQTTRAPAPDEKGRRR